MFVLTLFYILGQSLSLRVYFVPLQLIKDVADDPAAGARQTDKHAATLSTTKEGDSENERQPNLSSSLPSQLSKSNLDVSEDHEWCVHGLREPTGDDACVKLAESATPQRDADISTTKEKSDENENQVESGQACCPRPSAASTRRSKLTSRRQRGSTHGLTEESKNAVQWIHQIPYYWKPLIPGIFNLCNSAMRWASPIYC
jgi:PAB1-binding protein PBP1